MTRTRSLEKQVAELKIKCRSPELQVKAQNTKSFCPSGTVKIRFPAYHKTLCRNVCVGATDTSSMLFICGRVGYISKKQVSIKD